MTDIICGDAQGGGGLTRSRAIYTSMDTNRLVEQPLQLLVQAFDRVLDCEFSFERDMPEASGATSKPTCTYLG